MSYVDSDVIVDSKLTCMYISIDGIRLAKLVMYLGSSHGLQCFHACTYPSVEAMVEVYELQSFWFAQFGKGLNVDVTCL